MTRKPGWATARPALVFLATALTCAPAVRSVGSDLPTKGTFRGIYYVNRAGVGRLGFFIFHKKLLERMKPYEGKYVEGEVTLSWQFKPAPGKHRLRVSVTGDGGVYTNLRGKQLRKLDDTLVSNAVEFEVAE